MSYKSRNGVTTIKPFDKWGREKLSISYDDFGEGKIPVLLYVPEQDEVDHDHIRLTKEEAKELYDWLQEYLDEV